MRTLSEVIAKEIGTCGLAYSIHRTTIGTYKNSHYGEDSGHKNLDNYSFVSSAYFLRYSSMVVTNSA